MTGGLDVRLPSTEVIDLARVTYRQLDHWTRTGYVVAHHNGGSGHPRSWSLPEVAIVCRMGALVGVGFGVPMAARIAREGWPE